jgi:hypothetical protein
MWQRGQIEWAVASFRTKPAPTTQSTWLDHQRTICIHESILEHSAVISCVDAQVSIFLQFFFHLLVILTFFAFLFQCLRKSNSSTSASLSHQISQRQHSLLDQITARGSTEQYPSDIFVIFTVTVSERSYMVEQVAFDSRTGWASFFFQFLYESYRNRFDLSHSNQSMNFRVLVLFIRSTFLVKISPTHWNNRWIDGYWKSQGMCCKHTCFQAAISCFTSWQWIQSFFKHLRAQEHETFGSKEEGKQTMMVNRLGLVCAS